MAEDTTANADPSMEEILASIRKIISDDVPPAAETTPAAPAAVEPVTALATPAAPAVSVPLSASVSHEEDIVELTQMVQDDGSVVDLNASAPSPAPITAPPPPPPTMAATKAVTQGESLVSEPAASTAASALSSLASTLEIERLAHSPSGATYLGNGSRTLEDMVIELMRPLLKGWLDQNLPPIVERLVQKEIERISRRT